MFWFLWGVGGRRKKRRKRGRERTKEGYSGTTAKDAIERERERGGGRQTVVGWKTDVAIS